MSRIRIDELNPTVVPQRDHAFPGMRDGISNKIRIEQILSLLQSGDIPNDAVTLTKLAADARASANHTYDPTASGLTATDVQAAIDEAAGLIGVATRQGHIFGLTLSNNTSDPNNDIDIAAGEAASDDASPALITLASGITKRLDASWAVGDGGGGLDTGSKANSTWYYLWLIRRSDTGVVDALFSTSATSPTMPANYDQKRRLPGAVLTDASGNIRAFRQIGRSLYWNAPVENFSGGSRTLALLTISAPTAIVTRAMVQVTVTGSTAITVLTWQIGGSNVASPPIITLGTGNSANTAHGSIEPPPLFAENGQINYGGGGAQSTSRVFTLGFEDVSA